jgi:hypothetical protein
VLGTLIAAFVMRRREAKDDPSLFGPRLPRVMPCERQYALDEIEPGVRFPRTLPDDGETSIKPSHGHPHGHGMAPYYRHAPPYVRAPEYGSRLAQTQPPVYRLPPSYPSNAAFGAAMSLPLPSAVAPTPRVVMVTTTTTTIIEHASDDEDYDDLANGNTSGAPPPFVPPPEYIVPPDADHHHLYQPQQHQQHAYHSRPHQAGDDNESVQSSRRSLSFSSEAPVSYVHHEGIAQESDDDGTEVRTPFNDVYEALPAANTAASEEEEERPQPLSSTGFNTGEEETKSDEQVAASVEDGVSAWPPANPTEEMSHEQRVLWVKEEEKKRELTEYERKLLDDDFAEERKRAARDTFRDRFKLGAALLGNELQTAVGESARPMSVVENNSDDSNDDDSNDDDYNDDNDDDAAFGGRAELRRLAPVSELDSPPDSPPSETSTVSSGSSAQRGGIGGRLLAAARELSLGVEESVHASADLDNDDNE